MNDVDLLREAATLMRQRASGQIAPAPWSATGRFVHHAGGNPVAEAMGPRNAEHIASWHPVVTLADADLMWRLAQCWDALPEYIQHAAAAKARAYLGGAS